MNGKIDGRQNRTKSVPGGNGTRYNPDRIRVEKRIGSDYPVLYPDAIRVETV
jgi:hypothetical protein